MATKTLTPLKAIKQKCLECSCWQINEVRFCPVETCALWPYRSGHTPEVVPTYEVPDYEPTEAQKAANEAAKERFKKMWADRKEGGNNA